MVASEASLHLADSDGVELQLSVDNVVISQSRYGLCPRYHMLGQFVQMKSKVLS